MLKKDMAYYENLSNSPKDLYINFLVLPANRQNVNDTNYRQLLALANKEGEQAYMACTYLFAIHIKFFYSSTDVLSSFNKLIASTYYEAAPILISVLDNFQASILDDERVFINTVEYFKRCIESGVVEGFDGLNMLKNKYSSTDSADRRMHLYLASCKAFGVESKIAADQKQAKEHIETAVKLAKKTKTDISSFLLELGNTLCENKTFKDNSSLAILCYENAAAGANESMAYIKLAQLHLDGFIKTPDFKKAAEYLRKAYHAKPLAEKEQVLQVISSYAETYGETQTEIAEVRQVCSGDYLLECGQQAEQDKEFHLALTNYKKAAELNNNVALLHITRLFTYEYSPFMQNINYPEALKFYEKFIDRKNINESEKKMAEDFLLTLLNDSSITANVKSQFTEIFLKIATVPQIQKLSRDYDNPAAQVHLGILYARGQASLQAKGLKNLLYSNLDLAVRQFNLAANQFYIPAIENMMSYCFGQPNYSLRVLNNFLNLLVAKRDYYPEFAEFQQQLFMQINSVIVQNDQQWKKDAKKDPASFFKMIENLSNPEINIGIDFSFLSEIKIFVDQFDEFIKHKKEDLRNSFAKAVTDRYLVEQQRITTNSYFLYQPASTQAFGAQTSFPPAAPPAYTSLFPSSGANDLNARPLQAEEHDQNFSASNSLPSGFQRLSIYQQNPVAVTTDVEPHPPAGDPPSADETRHVSFSSYPALMPR